MKIIERWAVAIVGSFFAALPASSLGQTGRSRAARSPGDQRACGGQVSADFPDCKMGLVNPVPRGKCRTDKNRNDARTTEFEEKIGNFIKTISARERVVSSAKMTILCGISLGSCGRSVQKIFEYAQVAMPARQGLGASTVQQMRQKILSCRTTDKACRAGIRPWLRQLVEVQQRAWVERLQPGDTVQVYTGVVPAPGSVAVFGMHATLFVGWEDPSAKKWAKVIQGQWGYLVSEGRMCLGTNCGDRRSIMTGYGALPPE